MPSEQAQDFFEAHGYWPWDTKPDNPLYQSIAADYQEAQDDDWIDDAG